MPSKPWLPLRGGRIYRCRNGLVLRWPKGTRPHKFYLKAAEVLEGVIPAPEHCSRHPYEMDIVEELPADWQPIKPRAQIEGKS